MKKNKKYLKDNIRMERDRLGLSQSEAAEKARIPMRTYQDIEYGLSGGNTENVAKIAEAFGVSVEDLLKNPNAPKIKKDLSPDFSVSANVLLKLSEVSPLRRAVILAILNEDESYLHGFSGVNSNQFRSVLSLLKEV